MNQVQVRMFMLLYEYSVHNSFCCRDYYVFKTKRRSTLSLTSFPMVLGHACLHVCVKIECWKEWENKLLSTWQCISWSYWRVVLF